MCIYPDLLSMCKKRFEFTNCKLQILEGFNLTKALVNRLAWLMVLAWSADVSVGALTRVAG